MSKNNNLKPENQQFLPGFEEAIPEPGRVSDQSGFSVRVLDDHKRRDNRVSVRVSAKDLEMVKALALTKGTPYHSLLSSIIHEYVTLNHGDETKVIAVDEKIKAG